MYEYEASRVTESLVFSCYLSGVSVILTNDRQALPAKLNDIYKKITLFPIYLIPSHCWKSYNFVTWINRL